MVIAKDFADIIIDDGDGSKVILEKISDGARIIAPVETVIKAIEENWSDPKWQEYIARWRSEGRLK